MLFNFEENDAFWSFYYYNVCRSHWVYVSKMRDTDTNIDTDAIGLQTHFVGVGVGIGVGVDVGQCEHTIKKKQIGTQCIYVHSLWLIPTVWPRH